MSKVWAYYRHSTKDKQDKASQEAIVKRYCDIKGITIDDTIEEGMSGGIDYNVRKIMDVLRNVQQGDTVIVSEYSRLGRLMGDLSEILNRYFKPNCINLVLAGMFWELPCGPQMGAIYEGMLSNLAMGAQMERENCISRIHGGVSAAKERCRIAHENGRDYISRTGKAWPPGTNPFGGSAEGPKVHYRNRQASNEDVQTTKDMIRQMWKAGDSLKDIADELNRLQMPTPRGGRWWPTSVSRILQQV